jgi:hypothetical protein
LLALADEGDGDRGCGSLSAGIELCEGVVAMLTKMCDL